VAAHAAAYDARAETFAERTAVMPPELAALGERVLSRFPARARILDVGRGPGRDRAWFEERGATAVGVDVSPRMLELARARCAGDLLDEELRAALAAAGLVADAVEQTTSDRDEEWLLATAVPAG
jgi:SAM-dependent methyltransferase